MTKGDIFRNYFTAVSILTVSSSIEVFFHRFRFPAQREGYFVECIVLITPSLSLSCTVRSMMLLWICENIALRSENGAQSWWVVKINDSCLSLQVVVTDFFAWKTAKCYICKGDVLTLLVNWMYPHLISPWTSTGQSSKLYQNTWWVTKTRRPQTL